MQNEEISSTPAHQALGDRAYQPCALLLNDDGCDLLPNRPILRYRTYIRILSKSGGLYPLVCEQAINEERAGDVSLLRLPIVLSGPSIRRKRHENVQSSVT